MKPCKWIVCTILSFFLITPSIVLAADDAVIQDLQSDVTVTKGKADQNANAIADLKGGLPELQRQLNDLQDLVNSLPAGEPGPPGADGADGIDGLSCWDLNGNHFCDLEEEDKDLNNVCDALDCQGPAGTPGADAPDRTAELCALYVAMQPLGGPAPPDYCNPPAPGKVIFITEPSVPTDGSYSINVLDELCNAQASLGGLEGNFQAWLSTPVASPAIRSTHSTEPYVLVDGTIIANNWDDLTDGEINHLINLSAGGAHFPNDYVWTNTNDDGTSAIPDPNVNSLCVFGNNSNPDASSGGWSNYTGTISCATVWNAPIYCIEQ